MEFGVHGMESEEIACFGQLIEGWRTNFAEISMRFQGWLESHCRFFSRGRAKTDQFAMSPPSNPTRS